MANAPPLNVDIATQAQAFYDSLRGAFPSIQQWGHQLLALGVVAVTVCALIIVLLCCCKIAVSQLSQVFIRLKRLQLQQERDKDVPLRML